MKKFILSILILASAITLNFAQNNNKKPSPNKVKIEAHGIFISISEEDLEVMLPTAANLDRLPSTKSCVVEITGITSLDGQEVRITTKGEKPTCTEAAKSAQDALVEAKAAIAKKKE
jgi:hypothetical protein